MIIDLILIILLIVFSAFFSGSETGLTTVSRAKIFRLASGGNKHAKVISDLRDNKESLISTILLGNNLVNIAATALATSLAIRIFGDGAVVVVTIILTFIVLIFAEVVPKTIALQHSEKVALIVAPIISFLVKILSPITKAVNWLVTGILHILRVNKIDDSSFTEASEVIRGTIELHHQDGDVIKQDKDMLGSILDLSEVEVLEVMEHRKHVETIDFSMNVRDIINQAINSPHSRIPFWQDNPDNIIGLLHLKNLVKLLAKNSAKEITHSMIKDLLSEPWFVPETTILKEQLLEFRRRHQHFAHVVNEYGDFQGIITLEDIIEEIVGEIRDEHDKEEREGIELINYDSESYLVDGMVTIRDLNRHLEWNLSDEQASTVAGLVIHESRSIPEIGAILDFYGYRIIIKDKKANQILKLEISKTQPVGISDV